MKVQGWRNAVSIVGPSAILALCALFLFRDILVSGKCLYGSDFVLQFHPWKKFVFEQVQDHGSLPFWNPYLFSGCPLIANIQVSFFYPFGFLYYLMPPGAAYGYSTLLHVMMGCVFMAVFMRSLHVHPVGCLFSAVVFMFNGYFMGHLYAGHLSFVQNYVWIPLILLFLNAFVTKGSLLSLAVAGLLLGFQILGGFPQIAFYTLLASSFFLLFAAACPDWGERKTGPLRLGGGWMIFVLLGFSVAAVQVLPTYEFTKLSTRGGGISYAMATYESLHPQELLGFVLPDLFGNPVDGTYWRSRDFWHFWESCGYAGIMPLFLLFVGRKDRTFTRIRAFAVITLFFSLFLTLGKYNPLYPLIYRLPGFGSFRLPAQIIFLYVFSVAVLSGFGLSRMIEGEGRFGAGFWIFSMLTGVLLLFSLLGLTFFRSDFLHALFRHFSEGPVTHANLSLLYGRISHTIHRSFLLFSLSLFLLVMAKKRRLGLSLFSFLACAVLFADLYGFTAPFVQTHEFTVYPEKSRLVSQLSKTAVTGRVVTSDAAFKTNDGLIHGFPSVQGYDPLILKKYVNYVLASQGIPASDHVVNLQDIPAPQTKLMQFLQTRQIVSGGEVKDLANDFPYAFLVRSGVVRSEKHVLPFMQSDEFDPRKMVVFSEEPRQGLLADEHENALIGACEVLSYSPEEIRFKVSSTQPAYLVMSEIWYPGWLASVNGEETEVLCGNYLFRVVPVEAGNHEVRVSFVSRPFRAGAVVSAAAFLCVVLLSWRGLRSSDNHVKRRHSEEEDREDRHR